MKRNDFIWIKHDGELPTSFDDFSPWNLELPISRKWKNAKHRMLIIMESVPNSDLADGKLLGGDASFTFMSKVLGMAMKKAKSFGCKKKYELAFANYNHFPWYKVKDKSRHAAAHKSAVERIGKLIDKARPSMVIVFGDRAMARLSKDKQAMRKRGCVLDVKGIPAVGSLDVFMDAGDVEYEDQVNLIGYAADKAAHGFLGKHPHSLAKLKPNVKLANTPKDVALLRKDLEGAKRMAMDLETTGLGPFSDILTMQFATSEDIAWVVPITHKDSALDKKEIEKLRSWMRAFFGRRMDWSDKPFCVGQNFGFDMRVLMNWLGLRYWHMPIWDLQAGEYLLDENLKELESHGAPAYNLSQMLSSHDNHFYQEAEFSKESRMDLARHALKGSVLDYCAMDAQACLAIQSKQVERAGHVTHNEGSYKREYVRLMLVHMSSMVRVFSVMQCRGTMFDLNWIYELGSPDGKFMQRRKNALDALRKLPEIKKANKRLVKAASGNTRSLFDGADGADQLFSPKKREHMEMLCVNVLKLKGLKKTKKGDKISFDKKFLAEHDHLPAIRYIRELSAINKIKETYIDGFIGRIESSDDCSMDNRIRPEFRFVKTVTGRSSSENPNMQNIPEHGADAKDIKRMFVVPPMSLHFEADFSVHEIRCMAIVSGDKNLSKVFKNVHGMVARHRRVQSDKTREKMVVEGDVHRQNYSAFTGVGITDVTPEQRQASKGISFGVIYGMSDNSLAITIGQSMDKAKKIKAKFFSLYSKSKDFLDGSADHAKRELYITSPIGRRRNLPGYIMGNDKVNAALDRRAFNSVIQGLASDFAVMSADLYSRAMCHVMDELTEKGMAIDVRGKPGKGKTDLTYLPYGPNCMVHDSIKGEAHFKYYFLNLHVVEWAMTNGLRDFVEDIYKFKIDTPFDIDVEIGSCWAQKGKWDWTDKGKDELTLAALENHKEIYKGDKQVQSMNPAKTLAKMKAEYDMQRKTLDLDSRFPTGAAA